MLFENELAAATNYLIFDPRYVDPSVPTGLWICDGVLEVTAVEVNAVSLSLTGDWDDLRHCEGFFKAFPYLFIVCANPARREVMVEQVRSRVTYMPILVAEDEGFRGCKSITQLREQHGLSAVKKILLYQRELPAYGLLNLADVKMPDMSKLPKVYSGIKELDRVVGGFIMGMVSVWTGKRGAGKSTMIGQCLLESIDQGETVCAYSGELPDWQFKHWVRLQAAGPKHVRYVADPVSDQRLAMLPKPVEDRIDEWWDKQFLLSDISCGGAHDADNILKIFDYAYRRYGASVFLVDNIMTARFRSPRDTDYYRAQSDFFARLIEFAKHNKVHVHVVVHPRKTEEQYLTADSVGGSGDITAMADNIFSLEQELVPKEKRKDPEETEYDMVLSVLKNRMYGKKKKIKMKFDDGSKRFYRPGAKPEDRRFGWDAAAFQLRLEDAQMGPEEDPFSGGAHGKTG